jgi:hypothetical protein
MKIPSYRSYEWYELWEITERKEGLIYRTKQTQYHVPSSWQAFGDWLKVPFSTKLTRLPEIELNPHPDFK